MGLLLQHLLCLISLLLAVPVMAHDMKLCKDGPPLSYNISDISVELTYPGTTNGEKASKLTFYSSDIKSASSSHNLTGKVVQISNQQLIEIIKSLYQMNFFDMPNNLNRKYSVSLNSENVVTTTMNNMKDIVSSSICFRENDYNKCVVFPKDIHSDLNLLTDKLIELSSEDKK